MYQQQGFALAVVLVVQLAAGVFNGIEPRNSFVNTYAGNGGLNLRFGGKAMVFRPTKALPLWAAGRISLGRNEDESSKQGYLFFETMNTWEATASMICRIRSRPSLVAVMSRKVSSSAPCSL